MMNYETFKQRVLDTFVDYLPASYRNKTLFVKPIEKVNRVADGLTFSGKDTNVSAIIYINDMYQDYLNNGNFIETLKNAARCLAEGESAGHKVLSLVQSLDEEKIKSNIFFRLINTEQNKSLLEHVPHKHFLDLAVIYQLKFFEKNESKEVNCILTNKMCKAFPDIDLYNVALENSKRVMPAVICTMEDMFMSIMNDSYSDDAFAMLGLAAIHPESNRMWVITNSMADNGAAVILYADLKKISEELGADLYLLPSSIHEWLAVVDDGEPRTLPLLEHMVREANKDFVMWSDILSDHVYRYCRKTGEIEIASKIQMKNHQNIKRC